MNQHPDIRPVAQAHSQDPATSAPLPRGWEARARFDGGWTLARSGQGRQALVIRWATLALATVTGGVFLFGHGLLALIGRGIEPLALVLMGTGLAAIAWLEHRGPVYRLYDGRIERRSGLGGRRVRAYAPPSLLLTAASDDGWAVVLRHDQLPEILASGLACDQALSLAGFVSRHTGARVDVPAVLERELAEREPAGFPATREHADAPPPRSGTNR